MVINIGVLFVYKDLSIFLVRWDIVEFLFNIKIDGYVFCLFCVVLGIFNYILYVFCGFLDINFLILKL